MRLQLGSSVYSKNVFLILWTELKFKNRKDPDWTLPILWNYDFRKLYMINCSSAFLQSFFGGGIHPLIVLGISKKWAFSVSLEHCYLEWCIRRWVRSLRWRVWEIPGWPSSPGPPGWARPSGSGRWCAAWVWALLSLSLANKKHHAETLWSVDKVPYMSDTKKHLLLFFFPRENNVIPWKRRFKWHHNPRTIQSVCGDSLSHSSIWLGRFKKKSD